MTETIIYTKTECPYCAKIWKLPEEGTTFKEINLSIYAGKLAVRDGKFYWLPGDKVRI